MPSFSASPPSSSTTTTRVRDRFRATLAANKRHPTAACTRARVLVIGERRVGKSALLRRYLYERRRAALIESQQRSLIEDKDAFSTTYDATIGVDLVHAPGQVETRATLNTFLSADTQRSPPSPRTSTAFYDMSGDAAYTKVRTEFYADHASYQAIILCFDVTDRSSLERLDAWVKEVCRHGPQNTSAAQNGVKFHVIANKLDDARPRVVSERQGRGWASQHGYSYFETSARTGHGVVDTFDVITSAALHAVAMQRANGGGGSTNNRPRSASATRPRSSGSRRSSVPSATPSSSSASSSYPSSSASSSYPEANAVPTSNMTVGDLKRALARMSVPVPASLTEKSELVSMYKAACARERATREQAATAARARADKVAAAEQRERWERQETEKIVRQVAQWCRGKDIRAMLNDIHDGSSSVATLTVRTPFDVMSKAYKRALLKIHPDKIDQNDFQAHLLATEKFKAVNSAWTLYKRLNEQTGSGGGGRRR